MTEFMQHSATVGVVICLFTYEAGRLLKNRFRLAIFNPLLIAILLSIAFVLFFRIDYADFNASAKYLSYLLTPATVCLAIPLYQQIHLLKEHPAAILCGILSGVLTSLLCVWLLSLAFGLDHSQYVTLLPKSITTAIGMGISEEFGGNVSISVAVIIMTGLMGNMCAEGICKLFRIKSPIARGIAIGTAAHAMGTARALELGEIEGAMSSLSVVIAGIGTMVGASIFAGLL